MSPDNAGCAPALDRAPTPPPVDPAFHWDREGSRYLLRCQPLREVAQHALAVAQPPLPPGGPVEPPGPAAAADSVAAAAAALELPLARVMQVRQVHGRSVRIVRSDRPATADPGLRPDGDAVVADVPGLALAVRVADCVPILVADARGGVAAAVHAGWRGTCAGITAEAIAVIGREFGIPGTRLLAAIGPSIGPDDYEVGAEVRQAFLDAGHDPAHVARWFRPARRPGAWCLDLWAANRDQLIGAGVARTAIHVAGVSTMAHPGWLESYRRDGPRAGRMAAVIVVPERA